MLTNCRTFIVHLLFRDNRHSVISILEHLSAEPCKLYKDPVSLISQIMTEKRSCPAPGYPGLSDVGTRFPRTRITFRRKTDTEILGIFEVEHVVAKKFRDRNALSCMVEWKEYCVIEKTREPARKPFATRNVSRVPLSCFRSN